MPATVDELFGKQMNWPRLVIKFLIEGLLCYNFYNYATTHRTDWDCCSTERRQPNGMGIGDNVTATFTSVIYTGFILCAIGTAASAIEIINKKVNNK